MPPKRPPRRQDFPQRASENVKRRLNPNPDSEMLATLANSATYTGISKHKRDPIKLGLAPFTGVRGDATLCDEHANFQPADIAGIPAMLRRGILAGLIGEDNQHVPRIIWAISDKGWIFEGRITNRAATEYHGYPVRPSEAIAEKVYERFATWSNKCGDDADKEAAENCRARYGF